MNDAPQLLVKEYTAALQDCLTGQDEAALRRVYEAGRKALAEGVGVLQMVAAHQVFIREALRTSAFAEEKEQVLDQALSCLAESLSPFEMVLRGVQEANTRLKQSLNSLALVEEQLRRQNDELLAARSAVERQKSLYQELFDFAPDGYLVTGIEGAIREANTAAAALLRTPKDLLPGQLLSEFVLRADRAVFRERLRKLQLGATERIEGWELQIEPRYGPPLPAALTVVAERSSAPNASLRWLIRDDTERRRMEKKRTRLLVGHARARVERRFEFLAEASSLLVGSLDLEASMVSIARLMVSSFLGGWCFVNMIDSDGSIRQIEPAHADLSATDLASDLRGHCLFGVLRDRPSSDIVPAEPHIVEPLTSEWYNMVADGPEHAALLRRLHGRRAMVFPLRIHDRLLGILTHVSTAEPRSQRLADLALCEDLVRRCALALENGRLYRDVVAERDKANRANETKDDFVAMLGHELRNPLMPIVGWVQALESHPLICGDSFLSEGVNAMRRNTVALSRLVSDCLDLTNISKGKIRLDRKLVDLNQVVLESIEAVHDMATSRGLQLSAELAPDAVLVNGDALRLQQVVMNLLINAVKYTDTGGLIVARALVVDGEAAIAVTDNGIGIPSEQLQRIFEHYRQGTEAWLVSRSGLGLGLAIAQQIVQMHGGRIWAESQGRGCGSTFRVRLPRAVPREPESRGDNPLKASDRHGPSLRILLVEDSQDIQFLMKTELEKKGHVVLLASDGQQGIESANDLRPDLIVSDIKMPFMDGYRMIRAIRAMPELNRIPAIALTGFGSRADTERALAAGFNACVCKPCEPGEIVAVAERLVAEESLTTQYLEQGPAPTSIEETT